ncbi:hypothetical protein L7F22_042991 [Adiantum nelumboides]|nr:hypothetical protein [Adiantum nelumboides]
MRDTPKMVAPKWLLQAAVVSKSDVYSYGMDVLLELVSGQINLDLSRNMVFFGMGLTRVDRRMMEIVEERLQGMTWEMEKEAKRINKVVCDVSWRISTSGRRP